MASSESIVNVFKEKCRHSPPERLFTVLNHNITFEKFECQFRCNIETMNVVFLAAKESGPWTELHESMYSLEAGRILTTFPNTKYVKLVCLPPEQEDSNSQETLPSQRAPQAQNAFDIMKAASDRLWMSKTCLPDKKQSSSEAIEAMEASFHEFDERLCHTCGKTFKSQITLKRHVQIHNNEQPHVCTQCDKKYIKLQDLENHLKGDGNRWSNCKK